MKNTVIKGIKFTIKNSIECINNGITNIYQLYDKPSYEKVKAYNERLEKLDRITGLTGNKFNFSIYGYIYDNDGVKHNVKITQSYNYLIS